MIETIYEKGVENEKKNLVLNYFKLMSGIILSYTLLYLFYIKDYFIVVYTLIGLILTSTLYFMILKIKNLNITTFIRIYLFFAPLYACYLLLIFWKYTIVNIAWFIPIPLGAYILSSKKEVYFYSFYIILLIVLVSFLSNNYVFNARRYSHSEILISDIIVFIANLMVVVLLLYHRDRIKDIETYNILELLNNNHIINKPNKSATMDTLILINLFDKIEQEIESKELFKNSDFSLSKLSSILNVNPAYVSKAILYKKYNNFNHYINTLRIDYVKNLINKTDLQKVTLLYIYSEAGFTNQSTFNRAFKQIEGMSPTEYINSMNK